VGCRLDDECAEQVRPVDAAGSSGHVDVDEQRVGEREQDLRVALTSNTVSMSDVARRGRYPRSAQCR
jgi:aminoglycoside phosphotransferase